MTRTCFGHNLTILREYKNSYNEVATIFSFRWCGGMRLYAYVIPVCSIDAPAVSGVVLELWPAFGIAMPAYSRTEGYGRTFVVP